jgi:MFS family permease
VSTLTFIVAVNTEMLFAARLLSGFASGIAAGTGTAWIVELHPKRIHATATLITVVFNVVGLALGPLLAGFLAQYAPWPLRLPYIVYLGFLLPAWIIASAAEETIKDPVRLQQVLLKPRIGVPQSIRKQFIPPAATAFSTFALYGFYSALTPSLLAEQLHQANHAVGGAVVFELAFFASLAILLTRSCKSSSAMLIGLMVLLPSVALLESAREFRSMAILLLATALGGISTGMGYRGSLEVINRIAPCEQRAEVISAYFVACYIGLSLPVIGIGIISRWLNPKIANLTFAAVVALFAIAALGTGWKYSASRSPMDRERAA